MANTRVATGLYLSKSCMSLTFVVVYGLMEWNMFSFVGLCSVILQMIAVLYTQ